MSGGKEGGFGGGLHPVDVVIHLSEPKQLENCAFSVWCFYLQCFCVFVIFLFIIVNTKD